MAAATALLALAVPACSVDRTGNGQSSGAGEFGASARADGDAGDSGSAARRPEEPPSILPEWGGSVREVESKAPPRVELEGPIRVTYKSSQPRKFRFREWLTEVVTDGTRVRYDEALVRRGSGLTQYPTDPNSIMSSDHLVWDGTRFKQWCDIDFYALCWRGGSQVYRVREPIGYPPDLRWVMAIFSARGLSACDRLTDTREIMGRTAVGYKCESTRFPRRIHRPVQWLDKKTGVLLRAGHNVAVQLDFDPIISKTTFSTRPPCRHLTPDQYPHSTRVACP
jgi:hypothetical protein